MVYCVVRNAHCTIPFKGWWLWFYQPPNHWTACSQMNRVKSSIVWYMYVTMYIVQCTYSKSRIGPLLELEGMCCHYYMFACMMCFQVFWHFLVIGYEEKQLPPPRYLLKQCACLKIYYHADFDFAQILSSDSSFVTNMINDHQKQTHPCF